MKKTIVLTAILIVGAVSSCNNQNSAEVAPDDYRIEPQSAASDSVNSYVQAEINSYRAKIKTRLNEMENEIKAE